MRMAKWLAVVVGLVQLIAAASAAEARNAPGPRTLADPVTAKATSSAISVQDFSSNRDTQENTVTMSASVTGTTDDGGGNDVVCGVVFDDGDVVASQCFDIPVGSTVVQQFFFQWVGPTGGDAPGVGLYIIDATDAAFPDEGPTLAFIDPFFVVPVPTLSEWAQILMLALLVGGGLWTLRRRFSSPGGAGSPA
jgi:hypothetical protein